ncbi:ISAs1 family transposase [Mesorhizobium sp. M7A.F.Ca.US.008.03.1.1]|uniref:ISAs1 family transposase n=1 Tax=Mesorhizobium sp. M7A.F.Ca.US.008.03.1.1 TaxID=2496742 RepID=UPI001FE1CE9C|nr:ISAs1 family transposase [Mesorhizobium sp. M7A.F.Ca.US.008.03.1.1]
MPEVLFLVVCGTICDFDDYDLIADWGQTHLAFLRRYLPYDHGVPGGRWLTILMNRIDPNLFSAAFTDWVRQVWPDRPELIAIDGKTSRRSHDRSAGQPALHLVSAFATTSRLVLGQEAVADKSSELAAIPALIERLAGNDGLKGALVSIDAVATNATIARTIRDAKADYLLAVKANQPTLRQEIETFFNDAPLTSLDSDTPMSTRAMAASNSAWSPSAKEADWLSGDQRFPGELRLPDASTIIRVTWRTELKDRGRFDTRYYISSAALSAKQAAQAVRGHWAIENSLHWVLDVVFNDDQSHLRKGHGAKNMAVVRHFAFNLLRTIADKRSLKSRRKIAGWDTAYLQTILGNLTR